MPRQPMILDIPSKPGGVSSLIQGLTQGFMQGTMEQDREDRNARLRRELYRQQLDRENANYQRSRANKMADTADARKYEQGQYATRRADIVAEQLRKQQLDTEQARALAGAGGLPAEQSMPEGVAGPGAVMDYGKVGTEGVGRLLNDRRVRDQNAATNADRMADNERDAAKFEHKAGTDAEIAAYREKLLAQRGQQFDQTIGLRAKDLAEKERANRANESARANTGQKLTPEQKIKLDQWDRELENLYMLRKDKKKRDAEGWTTQQVLDEIANAEAEQRSILQSAAPAQQPTRQYPPDVLTEQDRAEYDALLAEQAGGR